MEQQNARIWLGIEAFIDAFAQTVDRRKTLTQRQNEQASGGGWAGYAGDDLLGVVKFLQGETKDDLYARLGELHSPS